MPHIPYQPRRPNPARLAPQAMGAAPPEPPPAPPATKTAKAKPEHKDSPRDTHVGLPLINMAEYRMDVDEVLAKMFGKEQLRG